MASDFARHLRRNSTDAERFVWEKLRGRRLANLRFRRQHPIGRYCVDFVCIEHKLIVELDGGQHDEQREYDAERTEFLERRGYRVIRYWNFQVLSDWATLEAELWNAVFGESKREP